MNASAHGKRMHLLSMVLTVGCLFLFSGRVDALTCADAFSTVSSSPESQIMTQVIEHQNSVRRAKNVPVLSNSFRTIDTEGRGPKTLWSDVADEFPDDPVAGLFIQRGNVMMRAHYNDTYALNYVYELDEGVMMPMPFVLWNLSNNASAEVSMYRRMSESEYQLWSEKKFDQLGRDWGYGDPIVHFSTSKRETSSAMSEREPTIEIKVSKQALMKLARTNTLWSGYLNPSEDVSEFVLRAKDVKRLIESGELSFKRVK